MPRGSHGHILREKTSDSRILEKQEASVNPAFKQDIGPTQETLFLHFLLGVCFVSIPDLNMDGFSSIFQDKRASK